MLIRLTYVLLFLSVWSSTAQNQYSIELTDENLGISLGDHIGVFEDSDNLYDEIDQVLNLSNTSFEQKTNPIPDFNFTNKRYWFQLSLINQSSVEEFIFETARPVTNKVEFFEFEGENLVRHLKSGDDFDYDEKALEHRKNLFPIHLEKGEIKTIFIKLESDGEMLFAPVLVHDRMAFFAQDFKDQFKNGFYFGLIALVVIIYFFFYLFLRDIAFLFYILYALSQGLLQFSLDGYSHHHFFPSGGYWANHSLLLFAGLTVIFLLTYVNNFLQLKVNHTGLWKVFYGVRIALVGIIVMSLIPGPLYEISFPVINGASLFAVLLAAYSIIRLRIKGVNVDIFFAMAFIILIIGGVVFILGNMSIVGDKMVSLGALKISSALEFVVLSISMSNKYGKLQHEKEAAQALAVQNLEEKNALMDEINTRLEQEVKERTSEINLQKEKLTKSNEEIVSSIKYAKRIQLAILPSDDHVKNLLPDSFIFYRPKDVVSGDFYFVETTHTTSVDQTRYTIFAAVDCTGHGVPGAFMSIVGNNFLNQSLTEPDVNSPAEALNYLNHGVNKTLRKSIDGASVRDGMDIAMCALNADQSQLIFAGAKNPLYLMRLKTELNLDELPPNAEVIAESETRVILQIKGDKHPIGDLFDDKLRPYTNHHISTRKGDQVFIFSDGYADQFGGPKGKKYSYRRFRNYLLEIADLDMVEQRTSLELEFEKWLGDMEQIDDVLVLSIRI